MSLPFLNRAPLRAGMAAHTATTAAMLMGCVALLYPHFTTCWTLINTFKNNQQANRARARLLAQKAQPRFISKKSHRQKRAFYNTVVAELQGRDIIPEPISVGYSILFKGKMCTARGQVIFWGKNGFLCTFGFFWKFLGPRNTHHHYSQSTEKPYESLSLHVCLDLTLDSELFDWADKTHQGDRHREFNPGEN